ncbi:MAG: type II secretion system F family protein [Acidimicrobiia bacterium]|nr:type II secretion system F family protein [Acidimicrobiia bacterium]
MPKAVSKSRPKINTYVYKLTTNQGVSQKGRLRALNKEQAIALAQLGQPGSQVERIREVKDLLNINLGGKAVKTAELLIFTRQLATFVKAGVPMVEAMASIGSENASRAMQDTLREISLDLAQGLPLSAGMDKHKGKVFPQFYIDLVRAGEITGDLDGVLQQAAKYLARQEETKRKLRSALSYPIVIGLFAIFAILVLLIFVLPQFVEFFKQFNATLPLPTRIVLNTQKFLTTWWHVLLLGLGLVVVGLVMWTRTVPGRYAWHRLQLAAPFVGPLVRYTIIERFCATLATMVKAGVPIVATFQVIIDGSRNVLFKDALGKVRDAMLVGQGISSPLAATGMFPAMVPQMIKVGEDTGTLDDQLNQASDFYAEELEYRLAKFTAIFEPMMILMLGGVVGFIGFALVSAMYDIYRQVGV